MTTQNDHPTFCQGKKRDSGKAILSASHEALGWISNKEREREIFSNEKDFFEIRTKDQA